MVRRTYAQAQGHQVGQREMATAAGWGVKAYESYEAGLHVPGDVWGFCLAVSRVTGCDPTWLAGDELPPPPGPGTERQTDGWQFGCIAPQAGDTGSTVEQHLRAA